MKKIIVIIVFISLITGCSIESQTILDIKASIFYINTELPALYQYTIFVDLIIPEEIFGKIRLECGKSTTAYSDYIRKFKLDMDTIVYRKIPITWEIKQGYTDVKRYIIKDTISIIVKDINNYFRLIYDITDIEIAEHKWNKENSKAKHNIWIKNGSKYDIERIEFEAKYFSKRGIEINKKILCYDIIIPSDSIKEISIKSDKLNNSSIINSASISIKNIEHIKKKNK